MFKIFLFIYFFFFEHTEWNILIVQFFNSFAMLSWKIFNILFGIRPFCSPLIFGTWVCKIVVYWTRKLLLISLHSRDISERCMLNISIGYKSVRTDSIDSRRCLQESSRKYITSRLYHTSEHSDSWSSTIQRTW